MVLINIMKIKIEKKKKKKNNKELKNILKLKKK